MGPVVVEVVYGGYAANDLTAALGEEESDPRMLVEGVLLGVELLSLGDKERGDPVRVVPVLRERVLYEPVYVGAGRGGANLRRTRDRAL